MNVKLQTHLPSDDLMESAAGLDMISIESGNAPMEISRLYGYSETPVPVQRFMKGTLMELLNIAHNHENVRGTLKKYIENTQDALLFVSDVFTKHSKPLSLTDALIEKHIGFEEQALQMLNGSATRNIKRYMKETENMLVCIAQDRPETAEAIKKFITIAEEEFDLLELRR